LSYIDGELGRYICSRYRAIAFSEDSRPVTEGTVLVKDLNLASKIIERAGSNLKSLHMDDGYIDGDYTESNLRNDLLNQFSASIPNIESISICEGTDEEVLRTFGKGLKNLNLMYARSLRIVMAIPLYCPNIRQLSLHSYNNFSFKGTNIWKSIGNTLEIIDFIAFGQEEEIGKIETHCRRLKKIDFYIRPYYSPGATASSKCLASFKDQLEYGTLSYFSPEQVKNVVDSCTNAQFKLVCSRIQLPGSLSKVGKQVETVQFGGWYPTHDDFDATPGWNLCPNVQKVTVSGIRLVEIQALLETPKSHLKTIELRFDADSSEVKNVMDFFATKWVTTLESITVHCALPPAMNTFKLLASRNKSLRYVRIELRNLTEIERNLIIGRVAEVVECFLSECSSLKILRITGDDDDKLVQKIDSVAEVLRTKYRQRRVDVSIFETNYD